MGENKGSGLGGFILGGLAGVALGLLFSPKEGSSLRQDLKEKSKDLTESARDMVERGKEDPKKVLTELVDEAQGALNAVRGMLEDQKQRVVGAIQTGVDAKEASQEELEKEFKDTLHKLAATDDPPEKDHEPNT